MTLTQAERDWLAALWRQAERDADYPGWTAFTPEFPLAGIVRYDEAERMLNEYYRRFPPL